MREAICSAQTRVRSSEAGFGQSTTGKCQLEHSLGLLGDSLFRYWLLVRRFAFK